MVLAYELVQLPQFRGVSVTDLQELVRRAEVRDLDADEALFRQGDVATDAWLVVSGELAVRVREGDRTVHTGIVEVGDLVGEQALYVPEGERLADIVARTPARLLRLTPRVFDDLAQHPALVALEVWLLHSMAHRIRATNQSVLRQWARTQTGGGWVTPEPSDEPPPRGPSSRRELLRQLFRRE